MPSFLSKIDLLGTYPQLYINKGYTYSTIIGGVISLFVWTGIIYALIAYTIEVLFVRTPNVINYSSLRSDVPIFNVTAEENFEFVILLLDKDNLIADLDSSIIDIRFQTLHTYYKTKPDGEIALTRDVEEEYGFGPCSEDIKNKMRSAFNTFIEKTIPDVVVCPQYDDKKERKIGGSLMFEQDLYESRITIGPKCDITGCTLKQIQDFKDYTSNHATQVMLAINYFIPNPTMKDPKINTFKHTMANLKKTTNRMTINFAEVSMLTDNNYVPLIGSQYHSTFFTVESVYNSFFSHGDDLPSLTTVFDVHITDSITIYERYYPKLDSIITRFFSFYLYCLYVGTIVKGCLYTYNLERYLINSTLINENSVQIKLEGNEVRIRTASEDRKRKSSGGNKDSEFNLRSNSFDQRSSISSIRKNIYENNLKANLVSPSQKEVDDMNRAGDKSADKSISSGDGFGINNFKNSMGTNDEGINPRVANDNNFRTSVREDNFQLDSSNASSDAPSDYIVLSQADSKLIKLRRIYDTIKEKKVRLSLRERYSCSSLPQSFKTNINYLYQVLDARNMIKLYLQFEKMKQIVFNEKQKMVFELFAVDISFLNNSLYNKNIDEMTDEELTTVIESLESVNEDSDEISKSLIKLLPHEFKKTIFNESV